MTTADATLPPSTSTSTAPRRPRRIGLVAFLALGVFALGAAGFARHGGPCGAMGANPTEKAAFVAGHLADRADATVAQEEAIEAELLSLFTDLDGLKAEKEVFRADLKVALTAKTVDAERLQELRAQALSRVDAVSEQATDSLAVIANVLTPEQRADLADDLERMHRRFAR